MKNIINKWMLLILLCMMIAKDPVKAAADTLYISDIGSTYLLFNAAVDLVDIGRPGAYFARIEGQAVFFKAKDSTSGTTSILVRYGDDYFTAAISYAKAPPQILYDFRDGDPTAKNEAKDMFDLSEGKINSGRIKQRLAFISQEEKTQQGKKKHRVKGLQKSADGLKIKVTSLKNDQEATYLGLHLENSTSIDYQVDFVGFSLEERQGRRFSKNNRSGKDVLALASQATDPLVVPAHGLKSFFYALPIYAMRSGGKLNIVLREKTGSRILRIAIPAGRINKAPTF